MAAEREGINWYLLLNYRLGSCVFFSLLTSLQFSFMVEVTP